MGWGSERSVRCGAMVWLGVHALCLIMIPLLHVVLCDRVTTDAPETVLPGALAATMLV